MFSLTDMLELFSDEFSGLRRRRLAFFRIAVCPLDDFFFRHLKLLMFLSESVVRSSMRDESRAYRTDATESSAVLLFFRTLETVSWPRSKTSCAW